MPVAAPVALMCFDGIAKANERAARLEAKFRAKQEEKLAQEVARQQLARRQVVETARQQPEPAAEAAPEPAAEAPPAPAPEAAPEEEAPAPMSDEWVEMFDEAGKGLWDHRWSTEQEEFLVDWVHENGGARETTDWAACAAAMNAAKLGVNRTAKQCLTRIVSLRRNQFRGARDALRAADERAEKARVAREAAEAEAEAQYEKDRRKPRSDDDMEFHMASMEVAQLLANGEEVPARLQYLLDDA